MPDIRSSIACNLDQHILLAALPLLEAGRVQALEWSFDALFGVRNIPDWFTELIGAFSREQRLIGHGVFFSLFSGRWSTEQAQWLRQLEALAKTYSFDHVTEHFGFMTGADFHAGAPLSVPFTASTLALGRDRLARMQQAGRCPVGLENLAFSYTLDEVKTHGAFLEQLVAPVNGFIILDLHNFYCQLHNFDSDVEELLACYPLHLVREIHISGGSWEDSPLRPGTPVRRDTHDDAVPEIVFDLLETVLPRCPNLKYVVLEQIGTGLRSAESRTAFQQDFDRMDLLVQAHNSRSTSRNAHDFQPYNTALPDTPPPEHPDLYEQQLHLSDILETATGYEEARERLLASPLAGTAWHIEQWSPYMLETALRIAQKWKKQA